MQIILSKTEPVLSSVLRIPFKRRMDTRTELSHTPIKSCFNSKLYDRALLVSNRRSPLTNVTMSSHQQQNNFEASCGAEILRDTSRIRIPWRKKIWLARGEVMDKFDNEVMPEIEALLQNEGPRYADYYFSVVMVGKRKETAKPKILVSCTNRDVRTEVLRIVKDSNHIREAHPEFGFGESSVPIHEPIPSVQLAGEVKSKFRTTPPDIQPFNEASSVKSARSDGILASDRSPSIGRKLFLSATTDSESARYATGGIVVRIGDNYYQKTAGHIDEPESSTLPQWSGDDVDYCRFDDDSDDEDDDALQFGCDITSRGSITPEDNRSQAGSESYSGSSETVSIGMNVAPSSLRGPHQYPTSQNDSLLSIVQQPSPSNAGMEIPHGLNSVGRLQHNSRTGKKPGLDYALILLDATFDLQKVNRICLDSNTNTYLQIRGVEAMPAMERDIITVTASGGITRGKLSPSAVYFRDPKQNCLQKLYIVHLDHVVIDGDCGADVVDEKTGNVYGHIVRGCRGTQIAYIVPATDVFEDVREKTGIDPNILLNDETEERMMHGVESQCADISPHILSQRQNDTHSASERDTERSGVSSKTLRNRRKRNRRKLKKLQNQEGFSSCKIPAESYLPSSPLHFSSEDSERSDQRFTAVLSDSTLRGSPQVIETRPSFQYRLCAFHEVLTATPMPSLSDFLSDLRAPDKVRKDLYTTETIVTETIVTRLEEDAAPLYKEEEEYTQYRNQMKEAEKTQDGYTFPKERQLRSEQSTPQHSRLIMGVYDTERPMMIAEKSPDGITFPQKLQSGRPTSAVSTSSSGSSGAKRGLGYNDASLVSAIVSAASTSFSWRYDWGFTNGGLTADVNYIPMLWGPTHGRVISGSLRDFDDSGSRNFPLANGESNGPQSTISYPPRVAGLPELAPNPVLAQGCHTPRRSSTDKRWEVDALSTSDSDSAISRSAGSQMPGTENLSLQCEFGGYQSYDYTYHPEDTEQWVDHIIFDHLRYQLPNKCSCWCCVDCVFDDQRNILDAMTSFRNRHDHICSQIGSDGVGYGCVASPERPNLDWDPTTWRSRANPLCPLYAGTISPTHENQTNSMSVLPELESSWQSRLGNLQEITMYRGLNGASENPRRTIPRSLPECYSYCQDIWKGRSASRIDSIGSATSRTFRIDHTHLGTRASSPNYNVWTLADGFGELVTWQMDNDHSKRVSPQQWLRETSRLAVNDGLRDGMRIFRDGLSPLVGLFIIENMIKDLEKSFGAVDMGPLVLPSNIAESGQRRGSLNDIRLCLSFGRQTWKDLPKLQRHIICSYTKCKGNSEAFSSVKRFRDHNCNFHSKGDIPGGKEAPDDSMTSTRLRSQDGLRQCGSLDDIACPGCTAYKLGEPGDDDRPSCAKYSYYLGGDHFIILSFFI
ncbi:hypothetical protein G7054_g4130 [Neopestalotiopsis clavispora]|nr:hypothetical protein G7054_g4130 [Neopestalotiopsis clavispora]